MFCAVYKNRERAPDLLFSVPTEMSSNARVITHLLAVAFPLEKFGAL